MKQKITTCLWFDMKAEEAANFYVSLFKNSKITRVSAMMVEFELAGQQYLGLNGGPHYKFTPAVSMSVSCEDQQEVDRLWERLTADGGQESRCGWLTDKYGLSWQIIPSVLPELMTDKDPQKAKRAQAALMQMKKIDIKTLQEARDGHAV